MPRRQLNANVGLSLGRFGSFAVAYIGLDRDATPAPVRFFVPAGTFIDQTNVVGGTLSTSGSVVSFVPAQHAKILTASYSVQIRNFSIYATGFHDFVQGGNTGVLFGVTVPLGVRSSISGSVGAGTGGANAQVQASQSVVSIGDFGYQVFGSAGPTTHEFAQLQYKSPWGLVSGGADRIGSQTAFRAEAQGALAYADGGVFASNTINDAFAVVDTGGTKGIRVLSENREAGRTDSAGRLLVPDLRSFDVNHISLDPTDVPADEALAFDSREVRPQDRSGVVVKFAVHASHGALLKLVDPAGNPIPPGSTGTLKETGTTVPVGFDGDAYVENLSEHNELAVELPDGRRCAVRFDYRAKKGEIPTIGPLTCGENRP